MFPFLLTGIVLVSLAGEQRMQTVVEMSGAITGGCLALGVSLGLITALIKGLAVGTVEERLYPNQGIRLASRNAWVVGLCSAVGTGLFVGLYHLLRMIGTLPLPDAHFMIRLARGYTTAIQLLTQSLIDHSLTFTFAVALGIGLGYGWFTCLQHVLLRLCLHANGVFPVNCIRFLNFATHRRLLYRSGGSYRFVHELLRDHLSDCLDHVAHKEGGNESLVAGKGRGNRRAMRESSSENP